MRINNPVPTFLDGQGGLLDNGQIWLGEANEDPEVSPIQAYWDPAYTIPAVQPVMTLAGTIRNGATPAYLYVDAEDFSMRVSDSNGAQISYIASYRSDAASFQPLADVLTAISVLSTAPYGLNLLTLPNQPALVAAIGGLNFLPLAGGTITGDLGRQGAGKHLYYAEAVNISGRVFVRNVGEADPTSQVGDIVFYV
jgi:hypothetical protein